MLAGAFAGFITNPIEYLAVNRQANPDFNVKSLLNLNSMKEIWFTGIKFRTCYYGV